jgi:MFS family permease
LCLTEITSWGILYYAFPVLAAHIETDTGWSPAAVTAAFSLALVVSGLMGIPIGRWLDRQGPRGVMTGGSVMASVAMVLLATAQSLPWFFAAWSLVGIAMAATLYAPAFAALTRWYGPHRVKALTTLTLVAGLASTVFAPLTAILVSHLSWRQTYLVMALILAAVTIPGHAFGLARPWPSGTTARSGERGLVQEGFDPRAIARSGRFLILTSSVCLAGFSFSAVAINLVPLLQGRGLTTSAAAIALGLLGAGQVAGRLGYARLVSRTALRTRTVIVLLAGVLTTALLALLRGPALLLVVAALLAGTARGIFTLLQATAISDRWGITHYGRLNGLMAAPVLLAGAVAPAAGAGLATLLGGYPRAFAVLTGVMVLATALAAVVTPRQFS